MTGNEDLHDVFDTSGQPPGLADAMLHPHGADLLAEIKEILRECESGKRLVEMASYQNIEISVISGRQGQKNTVSAHAVYLAIPARMKKPQPSHVLETAGAIREAEQELLGYKMPPKDADPVDIAAVVHAKYLDIIVNMCIIASELDEKSGEGVYAQALETLGHGDIYETFLASRGNEDDLLDTYFEFEEDQE